LQQRPEPLPVQGLPTHPRRHRADDVDVLAVGIGPLRAQPVEWRVDVDRPDHAWIAEQGGGRNPPQPPPTRAHTRRPAAPPRRPTPIAAPARRDAGVPPAADAPADGSAESHIEAAPTVATVRPN